MSLLKSSLAYNENFQIKACIQLTAYHIMMLSVGSFVKEEKNSPYEQAIFCGTPMFIPLYVIKPTACPYKPFSP